MLRTWYLPITFYPGLYPEYVALSEHQYDYRIANKVGRKNNLCIFKI